MKKLKKYQISAWNHLMKLDRTVERMKWNKLPTNMWADGDLTVMTTYQTVIVWMEENDSFSPSESMWDSIERFRELYNSIESNVTSRTMITRKSLDTLRTEGVGVKYNEKRIIISLDQYTNCVLSYYRIKDILELCEGKMMLEMKDSSSPAIFRGEGVTGLIMPMKKSS